MKVIKLLGVSVVAVALSASAASAKVADASKAGSGVVTPLPKASTLADNVVVTPQGTSGPTPVQPVQPVQQVQPVQPVQTVPVEPHRTVVTEDKPHNYMATIAVSALMGAVVGVLIGGAIYYIDTPRDNAYRIGYWAAGGVLVGTGVGLINVFADESRAERAVGTNFQRDPVPTYRLSLLKTTF